MNKYCVASVHVNLDGASVSKRGRLSAKSKAN